MINYPRVTTPSSRSKRIATGSAGTLLLLLACLGTSPLATATTASDDQPAANDSWQVPQEIQSLLGTYCNDCHSGSYPEADVALDQLDALTLDARLALLNRAQDQIFFQTMPPADALALAGNDRQQLADWIRTELGKHNASELDKKLAFPDYGNYVDHDTLFSGEITTPAFTPARRWLVSPLIFEHRVLDVFELEGNTRDRYLQQGFYGVTNPLVLPDHSGVRDYDIGTLGGGHLLVMLGNAEWIADKQLTAARIKKGELSADKFPNPKDRWYPPQTPAAFETIVLSDSPPAHDELQAAIQTQFQLVLQRPPSPTELADYTQLTRESIELAGNTAGLRQMLVTVLLESEFLYRMEFGSGNPDEHGRRHLAGREAAYAIAYALGDRGPDAELIQAAEEGRLVTKDDFHREVVRLLDDPDYFRGPVDKTVNGSTQNMRSRVTSHPRLVRFFREFFGYPAALKVFKDLKRSDGFYINPGRGSTQTPGHLINEADRIVTDFVEADQDVFTNLLTTDKYYLYHNVSNEEGNQRIENWRKAYEVLKSTPWQTDPEAVVAQYDELLRELVDPRGISPQSKARHDNSLPRIMTHFEHTFGQGNRPFTTFPWAHGNHYWHSPIYSLPETPRNTGKYTDKESLDYHPIQPFTIPNRKGILTHPAWLVAHSGNFQTDPIRRGRWIREKLLAGRVPDVPITVDAQVPEDPHLTFRQRVEGVTQQTECIKCHQHMNPLGFPFESYDDFGRYRTEESLEHPDNLIRKGEGNRADQFRTLPVDTTGYLDGTGNPNLDGPVTDAMDLIDRLAQSQRVRQSIIRHTFRFFMGRNEMLSDSQTLIDADRAYVESGGSFRAVVVSLLTSDSFMYRKDMLAQDMSAIDNQPANAANQPVNVE